MLEIRNEPAQTYQLNAFASVLGRYAVPEIDRDTCVELEGMFEEVIEDIEVSMKPALPHTNPVLVNEALVFDRKLEAQLSELASFHQATTGLTQKSFKHS